MTLEYLGSFYCPISPQNVVTNWQKAPAGPSPLHLKAPFALAEVLVQWLAVGACNQLHLTLPSGIASLRHVLRKYFVSWLKPETGCV